EPPGLTGKDVGGRAAVLPRETLTPDENGRTLGGETRARIGAAVGANLCRRQARETTALMTPLDGSSHWGNAVGRELYSARWVIQGEVSTLPDSIREMIRVKSLPVELRVASRVISRRWKSGSLKEISPCTSPTRTIFPPLATYWKDRIIEAALPVASKTAVGISPEVISLIFS